MSRPQEKQSEPGNWTVESAGDHPCDVWRPANWQPGGPVVLYLHGVHQGRLEGQAGFEREIRRHKLAVVAPRTGRSWWSRRIAADFDPQLSAYDHVLQNVLPLIQRLFGSTPPRIGLLGTSMGGQGALRLAYDHPDTFPAVAAISPAIDFYRRLEYPEQDDDPLWDMYGDPEAARQDSAILYIHPLHWPRHQFFCCDPTDSRWYDSSDRLRMKLASLGVPFQCDLETVAGGHGFSYYNRMAERAISFLVEALQSESLRIAH